MNKTLSILTLGIFLIVLFFVYTSEENSTSSPIVQEPASINETTDTAPQTVIIPPVALEETPKALLKLPDKPDKNKHPLTEQGELLISQVTVVDDYALVHGDILIAGIDEMMDLERRGELPKLAPPALWPDGIVYYEIAPEVDQRRKIMAVIDYFHKMTPIRFQEVQGEENFVQFVAGEQHCFAHLGMIGGPQKIVLSPACSENEIAHEVMHSLGFVHEQNREDRDKNILVNWENIEENYDEQFKVIPRSFHLKLNEKAPFDFESRMLYSPFAFAKDSEKTTMTKTNGDLWKQTKQLLSPGDIERLRSLY